MTVEPMTDVDRIRAQWITDLRGAIAAHKHDKHMQVSPLSLACLFKALDEAKATISTLTAERDAALARAMPGWRYLATWDAVNAVEARHNDEPAPGLYAIWKPGWPYPSAASVQFGVFATDEESPAPDDYLLGAWISGPLPLPDLPTHTDGGTP